MTTINPLPLPSGARTALLVIDMQVFFFRSPERRVGLEVVVANINRLIDHFDAAKLPIYHVITAYREDGSDWDLKQKLWGQCELIAGTPDAEMLSTIHRNPAHVIMVKTRYSAFHKTGLAERLAAQEVQRVLVVGAYTHYCVNQTIFDAFAYDFIPAVVTDATISNLPDEAERMLARMARNGYHLLRTEDILTEMGNEAFSST
jgi:nicotinamidase-related amidase